jgi:spore germination cell wall hydrolase CwlJ-like protein
MSTKYKLFLILFTLTCSRCVPLPASTVRLTDQQAILAIIGEAEGESLQGKIAVAEVIRNRGYSLKGIYGIKAPRVVKKLYSQKTYNEAKLAWETSKTSNLTNGAMGWGNADDVKIFKTQKWFKSCRVTKQIGNHYFWAPIKKG